VRAIQVERTGGPEVLQLAEIPERAAGPREILVRQSVAGINFIDTSLRRGRIPRDVPFVPGREGVGTVIALGEEVTEFALGDRIGYSETAHLGGYAEVNRVPVAECVPIPADIDDATACALMLQGITAQYLCTSTYAVGPGEWILVHAASGGVGRLLVQLAAARGARVIGTAGGPQKVALARSAGAEAVIDYRATDFAPEVMRLTDGAGVSVAYDSVGLDTWERSMRVLRRRGCLVLYGASSGRVPPIDIQLLGSGGSLFVTRPTATDYKRERPELLARAEYLFEAVRAGTLDVRIGHRYPLADAAEAHRALENRETTGKLLLEIGS
jgi:NADPH2:quinone reductase